MSKVTSHYCNSQPQRGSRQTSEWAEPQGRTIGGVSFTVASAELFYVFLFFRDRTEIFALDYEEHFNVNVTGKTTIVNTLATYANRCHFFIISSTDLTLMHHRNITTLEFNVILHTLQN